MTGRWYLLAIVFFVCISLSSCSLTGLNMDPQWRLLWREEFDTLNTTHTWSANTTSSVKVQVENGNLIFSNQGTGIMNNIISSQTFSYGRIEMNVWAVNSCASVSLGVKLVAQEVCFPVGNVVHLININGSASCKIDHGNCCGVSCVNSTNYAFGFNEISQNHIIWIDHLPTGITWYVNGQQVYSVSRASLSRTDGPTGYKIALDSLKSSELNCQVKIDYIRFYVRDPCEGGCENGCCDEAKRICVCNPGWMGSRCEINPGGYHLTFDANIVDSLSYSDYCQENTLAVYPGYAEFDSSQQALKLDIEQNSGYCPGVSNVGTHAFYKAGKYGTYTMNIMTKAAEGTGVIIKVADFDGVYSFAAMLLGTTTNSIQLDFDNYALVEDINLSTLSTEYQSFNFYINSTHQLFFLNGTQVYSRLHNTNSNLDLYFNVIYLSASWMAPGSFNAATWSSYVKYMHYVPDCGSNCRNPVCVVNNCGNGFCSQLEKATGNCPLDCNVCGDRICSAPETFVTCPQDCGICGDGECAGPETCWTCAVDCCNCTIQNGQCGQNANCYQNQTTGQGSCHCPHFYSGNPSVLCSPDCTNATTCHGNGHCNATAGCVCDLGFDISSNCNTCLSDYHSSNCLYCNPQVSCHGNGSCNSQGLCDCLPNFNTSANCSSCINDHYGPNCIYCDDDVHCHGNGTCNSQGFCDCLTNFNTSTNCSSCIADHYGANCIYCDADIHCHGNGTCNSEGFCECLDNFDASKNCSSCIADHYGPNCIYCDSVLHCNGNGICNDQGLCHCTSYFNASSNCTFCDKNYYGSNCDIHCNRGNTCHGNGICNSSGMCLCNEGYNASTNCSTCEIDNFTCTRCNAISTCHGNGVCSPEALCECITGYDISLNCSTCADDYYAYPNCIHCVDNQCGHGSCNELGYCLCEEGYNISTNCNTCDADFYNYPNCTKCIGEVDCSGNGYCNSRGLCVCENGYDSYNCSSCAPDHYLYPTCTRCVQEIDCHGHGTCNNLGLCECDVGFDPLFNCSSTVANCFVNNGECDYRTICSYGNNGERICSNCPLGTNGTGLIGCNTLCGNGICEVGVEDCSNCRRDCNLTSCDRCGDKTCSASENCTACPEDCGPCARPCKFGCVNGKCENGECVCQNSWTGPACNNSVSLPVLVTFPNTTTPLMTMLPLPSSSKKRKIETRNNQATPFFVSVDRIEEMDSSSVIRSYSISDLNFTLNEKVIGQNIERVYSANLINGASFSVVIIQFEEKETAYEFAGTTTIMQEHTLKVSIRVTNWPFLSLYHSLGIVLSSNIMDNGESVNCNNEDIDESGNLRWITVRVNDVYLYGQFVEHAEIDDRIRSVKYRLNPDRSVTAVIPHFWFYVDMDPKYSVLVGDSNTDCEIEDDTGTFNKSKKGLSRAMLIVAIVVPVAVVAIVAFAGFFVFSHERFRVWKHSRKIKKVEMQSLY